MKFHFAKPTDCTPRNGWWRINYITKQAWDQFVAVMHGNDITWFSVEFIDSKPQPIRKQK